MNIKYLIMVAFIVLCLHSCNNKTELIPFEKQELVSIKDYKDLSCLDYLRLCSSFDLVRSVFRNKDISVKLFLNEINSGFDRPVILLDGRIDFKEWISSDELSELKSLKVSKQKCWPITNSYSSKPANYYSTIGNEASFLLKLFEGQILMTSKDD